MLALARSNYERAEITKEKILAQGLKSCNLAKETLYATLETDLARLKEATSFTLKLKEKKYFFDLYDDILDSSFSLATKNFSKVLSNKRFRKKKFLQKTERLYRM
jgi:vacuolar-type H+-ATPase subunit E/Vma4